MRDYMRFSVTQASYFSTLLPRTSGARWPGNRVYNNSDAGIALMESFRANVSHNVFEDNKYGVRLSVGCADNLFYRNTMSNSTK